MSRRRVNDSSFDPLTRWLMVDPDHPEDPFPPEWERFLAYRKRQIRPPRGRLGNERKVSAVLAAAAANDVPRAVEAIRAFDSEELPWPERRENGGDPDDPAYCIQELHYQVRMMDYWRQPPADGRCKICNYPRHWDRFDEADHKKECGRRADEYEHMLPHHVGLLRQVVLRAGTQLLLDLIDRWGRWYRDWPEVVDEVEARVIRIIRRRPEEARRDKERAAEIEALHKENLERERAARAGGAWGMRFMTMFSMSEDSHLFRTAEELEAKGYRLDGNIYRAPPPAEGEA